MPKKPVAIDLFVRRCMKAWQLTKTAGPVTYPPQLARRQPPKRPVSVPAAVSGAPVQKGFSAMNFRILAAPVRPRGRVFALLAATRAGRFVVGSPQAQAQPRRAGSRTEGQAEGGRRKPHPLPSQRRRRRLRPGSGRARRRRPASGTGSADLCALDQILPEGPGCQRQAGLLHRQGWADRVRPARGRGRHHRARRRAEENPARHASARHAARSRHPRDRRQQPSDAEPLCDLLRQWLHVGLRS